MEPPYDENIERLVTIVFAVVFLATLMALSATCVGTHGRIAAKCPAIVKEVPEK